jgi:hypothetical protein
MSWQGERGTPGCPGLDKSDYELIVLALEKYTSDQSVIGSLSRDDLKNLYITQHLVKQTLLWYDLKTKLDLLQRK